MNNPLISILMSVYNDERYLRSSIESMLGQVYRNYEFIIADDGSADGTSGILDEYALKDNRIKVIRQENAGLTRTLNKLIKQANGKYIARQDSDDISDQKRLLMQVQYMESNPDVALLGTGAYIIDENGNILIKEKMSCGRKTIKNNLIEKNQFVHGSVMFRKQCLDESGFYYEEYKYAEDYDLFLRISEKYNVNNLKEPLYYYRINPKAISSQCLEDQTMMGMIVVEAARMRRKTGIDNWSAEKYKEIAVRFDNHTAKTELKYRVFMAKGRNYRLLGNNPAARDMFLHAFRLCPSLKPLWHYAKTFFQRKQPKSFCREFP